MNNDKITREMIDFIEKAEKEYVAERNKDVQKKKDMVNTIIKHLEQEIEHED